MAVRIKATSPFLPTAEQLSLLPANAALRRAMEALPPSCARLSGPVTLDDVALRLPGVRIGITEEQIDEAHERLITLRSQGGRCYAKNSWRTIRSDWRHWIAFCVLRDHVAMPVRVTDLQEFLNALIDAGYKRATLEHLLFTFSLASRLWGRADPMASFEMETYWRNRCRQNLSRSQHRAVALHNEDVITIIKATDPNDRRELRDAAMVSVAYDLMLRAAELAGLRWERLEWPLGEAEGATYHLEVPRPGSRHANTLCHLTPRSMTLLSRWKATCRPESPFIFHALPRYEGQSLHATAPLSVREVARVFQRAARHAGIEKVFTGQSARIGSAQDMTRIGMNMFEIMQIGRWKSTAMLAKYFTNFWGSEPEDPGARQAESKFLKRSNDESSGA